MKNKCQICLKNDADKKNSHIISKFLSKELLNSSEGNFAMQLNQNGKTKKIQSTAKENHILCTDCEKRLEILETYIAKLFPNLIRNNNKKKEKNIILKKKGIQTYLELQINPSIFKLFIYSLVYRCSISSNEAQKDFKLPYHIEEIIRAYLNEYLVDKTRLLNEIKVDIEFNEFNFCLIMPQREKLKSSGIYCTYQSNLNEYIIVVDNFILFFYIDDNINDTFKYFTNKNAKKITIPIVNDNRWYELNKLIVEKIIFRSF